MDKQAAASLAAQLLALGSVVSALVLYLLCKARKVTRLASHEPQLTNVGGGRAVLVTSADNLLGLQLSYHLAVRGFRVFAGLKPSDLELPDLNQSTSRRILENKWNHWVTHCEMDCGQGIGGSLVLLPLDVMREDLLHEAVGTIRRHLPAGEDGLWAVVNTAGMPCRDLCEDVHDSAYWDAVIKLNVTGTLKVSRTFLPLLRSKKGRLVNLGAQVQRHEDTSLPAHTAGRYAVEGASAALRLEMRPLGVKVVTLQPEGLPLARLLATPNIPTNMSPDTYLRCDVDVLPARSLAVLEEVMLVDEPRDSYPLQPAPGLLHMTTRLLHV